MTNTLHVTDHHLKESITAELAWTPSVVADHVGVSVSDGAVTLSGQVQTYPEKHSAVRAALRVRGVTAVADEIEVRNKWAPRQDADIAREASDAIARTVFVPAGSVKAEVADHVVTLTGTLAWHYQRDTIRAVVAGLPGVHGVRNEITLKPTVTISAADAKTNIVAALRRNAELDAQHVHVEVTGSTITLTGSVRSWAERRQASMAAWATPGVTHVGNELAITS